MNREGIAVQVRIGDIRDWPFVYALSREVIPVSISPWRKQPLEKTMAYREQLMKGYWAWIQKTGSVIFIAEDHDAQGRLQRIGYLILNPSAREELTGLTQGWIMDVAVLPEWRGRGAGRALLHAAEKYCRERRIEYLGLAVSSHNTRALKVYQKHGFIEERKLMVKVLGAENKKACDAWKCRKE